MYITLEEYNAMYDVIDISIFHRLEFEARRVMDLHTTGIDNVRKLHRFPPRDEYNALAVKHCAAKIINLLFQIHEAEASAAMGRGYTETEQGLQRRIISRVEAGNEAISYSETKLANTVIDEAVSDRVARDKLLAETVWDYLRGVEDANGVNLLYMGKYPRRYL
jgi:hypothetical protein